MTTTETPLGHQILDLDEFLAGDVRLAETTARFCIKPDLEADIAQLNGELDGLTDANGDPYAANSDERALGDLTPGDVSAAVTKAQQVGALQQEYAAAMRSVRLTQMDVDEWDAFQGKHKAVLEGSADSVPAAAWVELVAACSLAPRMSVEQVTALRKRIGAPQFMEIAMRAWRVNTEAGMSVPKSAMASQVLARCSDHGR